MRDASIVIWLTDKIEISIEYIMNKIYPKYIKMNGVLIDDEQRPRFHNKYLSK